MEFNSNSVLEPGFILRFYPTDQDLITYYLRNKVLDISFSAAAIGEVDINKCEPWELPAKAKMGDEEWYFFSPRNKRFTKGQRADRLTEVGYWKVAKREERIHSSPNCFVGTKRTLWYYYGRRPSGLRSNWVMVEYRLDGEFAHHYVSSSQEWMLLRVFQRSGPDATTAVAGINLYPSLSLVSPPLPESVILGHLPLPTLPPHPAATDCSSSAQFAWSSDDSNSLTLSPVVETEMEDVHHHPPLPTLPLQAAAMDPSSHAQFVQSYNDPSSCTFSRLLGSAMEDMMPLDHLLPTLPLHAAAMDPSSVAQFAWRSDDPSSWILPLAPESTMEDMMPFDLLLPTLPLHAAATQFAWRSDDPNSWILPVPESTMPPAAMDPSSSPQFAWGVGFQEYSNWWTFEENLPVQGSGYVSGQELAQPGEEENNFPVQGGGDVGCRELAQPGEEENNLPVQDGGDVGGWELAQPREEENNLPVQGGGDVGSRELAEPGELENSMYVQPLMEIR